MECNVLNFFLCFVCKYYIVKVVHEIMGHFTLMRNFWSHKVSHFIWKCQNFGGNIALLFHIYNSFYPYTYYYYWDVSKLWIHSYVFLKNGISYSYVCTYFHNRLQIF